MQTSAADDYVTSLQANITKFLESEAGETKFRCNANTLVSLVL